MSEPEKARRDRFASMLWRELPYAWIERTLSAKLEPDLAISRASNRTDMR
jgi:hypothetical protein